MVFKRKSPATAAVRQLHSLLDENATASLAGWVRDAEKATSAEIMVRLAADSGDGDIRATVESEFVRLGLEALPLQNGVLLFIALDRRAVELVVGSACVRKIAAETWQETVERVVTGFQSDQPLQGIKAAIEHITTPLATAFPPESPDRIDLPNVVRDS